MLKAFGEKTGKELDAGWFGLALLGWYDAHGRDLPWRAPPGGTPDPYAVWLSEIMLQQTTVKAVTPYYAKFLARWPTVEALAAAPLDDVLSAWAGLGYYARARNLHACAKAVAHDLGGAFPAAEKELIKLPGIGAYTAAAIAAIAFNQKAAVVDGNVERVLARFCAVRTPLPKAKPELKAIAKRLAPETRPGDFAQAMMDLGATLCSPRSPVCALCPLKAQCEGHALGLETILPYREAKRAKPTRSGALFFALREDGAVLLRKRPSSGLLGGMTEIPGTPWKEAANDARPDHLAQAPIEADWLPVAGVVRHTFTHFHLELSVFAARVGARAKLRASARPGDCLWVQRRDLEKQALPSVMRKVVAHALDHIKG